MLKEGETEKKERKNRVEVEKRGRREGEEEGRIPLSPPFCIFFLSSLNSVNLVPRVETFDFERYDVFDELDG